MTITRNYIALLLLLGANYCWADDLLTPSATWSFSLGNINLFDIPKFPSLVFDEGSSKIQRQLHSSVKSLLGDVTIDPNIIEDSILKTPDLIRKYGYPSEVHHAITDDGYILELHRIANHGAMPVLLTHGLLDSSATWVMMGPNKGLAYLLYEKGYDVWMTNVRGNTYSRNHTKYTTNHAAFWDFTFHEMGKYDLPATINYILDLTSEVQLHYIGHSQGTMTYFIMCSERPDMCDKVLLMQALAPVAYIKHAKSPVVEFMAFFQEPLALLLKLIGAHEFLPSNEFISLFTQIVCDENSFTEEICSNVIFLVAGFDKQQMNETMLPVVLGHAPAGAATKQMQHYGQLKHSGHFRQYDYGWIRNHWRYGSINPPDYKLDNVHTKVALHYSLNDWLATPKDVETLRQGLPNVVSYNLVNDPKFNHLDFVWGIDSRELLYNKVLDLMEMTERGDFDEM
ncbi:lipase 3-like [Musca domestica]|uniref:Lipase 3-like n=1 Tax=Musca domestica TaxID=7370 RepID=A0A1I8MIJ0_MUSDO|nr:lipase 3-like [Musca domestica]